MGVCEHRSPRTPGRSRPGTEETQTAADSSGTEVSAAVCVSLFSLGFRLSVFPSFPLCCSRLAIPIERVDEIVRDLVRRASLDLPPLEHEHELAVLEEADLRRRRRISREV